MGLKAGWLLLVSLPLLGQSGQQSQEIPTFKSESALVLVDVVARDAQGRPVKIQSRDWQVFENGHERPIVSIDEHTTRAPLPTLQGHGWNNNRAGAQSSQRGLSIILLDSLNMLPSEQILARHYVLDALRQLPGGERFMIFLLLGDLKQVSGTTDDLSLVEDLLKKQPAFNSQLREVDPVSSTGSGFKNPLKGDVGLEPGSQDFLQFEQNVSKNAAYYRAKITLQAFKEIAAAIARQPGRKSLIWLTSSFPINVSAKGAPPAGSTAAPIANMPGPQPVADSNDTMGFAGTADFTSDVNRVAKELAAARVSVYPIVVNSLISGMNAAEDDPFPALAERKDMFALNGTTDRQAAADTARVTADQTGGRATVDSNDIGGAFTRAVSDGDNYYTISFVPERKMQDGKLHPILIRPIAGVELQYRRSYVAAPSNDFDPRQGLREALDLSLPETWQIEAAGRYLPNPPSTVELRVSTSELQMEPLADGRARISLLVGYVAAPNNGAKPEMSITPVELSLNAEELARAGKQGVVLALRPQLPNRASLLRVGVLDLNSRKMGTLDIDTKRMPRESSKNAAKPYLLPDGRPPDPEDGILTNRMYRSLFFDFTISFPTSAAVIRERVPIMRDGNHALLAASFWRGTANFGGISVYAIEQAVAPSTDPEKAAEIEIEEARKTGANVQAGTTPGSYIACSSATKICTNVRIFSRAGFLLKFVSALGANSSDIFQSVHLRFVQRTNVKVGDGELYHGPSVPARLIDLALMSKLPGLDKGVLSEHLYSNSSLGLEYGVPSGWSVLEQESGTKTFEQFHSAPPGTAADRQHRFLAACSQSLLHLQRVEGPGEPDYLSLYAVMPSCLDLPIPSNWEDKNQILPVVDFLSQLADFGEVLDARTEEISGKRFVVLHSEITFLSSVSGMQSRRYQTAFVTLTGNHLLAWFLVSARPSNQGLPAAALRFSGCSAAAPAQASKAQ